MRHCPEASIDGYRGSAAAATANHPRRNNGVTHMELTPNEKFILIRNAAAMIGNLGIYANGLSRNDILHGAERIIELVKSIPASDWP